MGARTAFACAALWLAAATALAAEAQLLAADEVRKLITGNSIQSQDVASNTTFWVYFDPNGRRAALQDDGEYELPWRVQDDGTHCVRTGSGDDCARVRRNPDGTYSRMRSGQAVVNWLMVQPGKTLGPSVPGPGMYLRRRGQYDLEFTLVSDIVLEEPQAQARIMAAAVTACGSRKPVAGRYRFQSTQPLDRASDAQVSFQFMQEVHCAAEDSPDALVERQRLQASPAQPISPQASRQIEDEVRRETEAYFRALADGNVDAAFARISPTMGVAETPWKESKRSLRTILGEPVRITVTKITLYDNPANAPAAGLYVAADFTNEFRNAPLHCGYLVWIRAANGRFEITREDAGHVTSEQLAAIPVSQHAQIRQQMRCAARSQQ